MVLFSLATFVLFHFALDRDDGRRRPRRRRPVGDAAVRRHARASTGCSWPSARRAASTASCSRRSTAPRCSWPRRRCCSRSSALVEVVAVPAFAILLLGPSPWPALPGLVARAAARRRRPRGDRDARRGARRPDPRARPDRAAARAPAARPAGDRGRARDRRRCSPQAGAGALEGRWLLILGLYDLVFGLLAYAIFDFLLED